MKKYLISISEELGIEIEKAIKRWGFSSKTEFFRYAAIDFIRNDGRFMPADEMLNEHNKAIIRVKARQGVIESTRAWKKENPYVDSDMG
ncbi:hypothetical protein KJ657_02495 [Patescibacteria group bacterium]|nr:hypothetical protein [Patescibacteria group bacterium]MBU1015936.1 hypothetical protein [Patescibacteria group bacterium]MBU1685495.1 hypothetical protein [Patescibacteria group bacterium]MBU1938689.1 hypothetical protein [Patescibacteria group bacterium]